MLDDADRNNPKFLTSISQGRLSLPLNDVSTFDCSLDIDSTDLKSLLTMLDTKQPMIRLMEDGETRFFGPLSSLDVTLDESGSATASFTDLAGPLANIYAFRVRSIDAVATAASSGTTVTISNTSGYVGTRGVHRGMAVWLNGVDTGRTVSSIDGTTKVIISSALAVANNDTLEFYSPDVTPVSIASDYAFITDGLIAVGESLIQLTSNGSVLGVYQELHTDGITVLDALKSLSERDNGMDWYVSASSAYTASPDATIVIGDSPNPGVVTTTQLGVDRSNTVVFEFGPTGRGNIISANVQHLPPVNTIYMKDDGNRLKRQLVDDTSVLAYGERGVYLTELDRRSDFADVAAGALRPNWRRTCSLVLEPTVAPRPWTDFYLGDFVRVNLAQSSDAASSMTIGKQRVSNIELNFDESLVESSINIEFEVV